MTDQLCHYKLLRSLLTGTQQYGDAMTNIVVVQFNDYVQTSRDKKYNLTCYFSGPGEAVITSNYLDTKTDP